MGCHRTEAEHVQRLLVSAGFLVELVHSPGNALGALSVSTAEGVVMDITEGRADMLALLRHLRAVGWRMPVMLLAAMGEVSAKVEGLDAGGDDYLTKPYSPDELLARVRALARRGADLRASALHVGDLTLNPATRLAIRGGRSIPLTQRECEVAALLMTSPGKICDRTVILDSVWGEGFDSGSNIVDVYVRKLRRKIDTGHAQKLIHSIRGAGYMMREP